MHLEKKRQIGLKREYSFRICVEGKKKKQWEIGTLTCSFKVSFFTTRLSLSLREKKKKGGNAPFLLFLHLLWELRCVLLGGKERKRRGKGIFSFAWEFRIFFLIMLNFRWSIRFFGCERSNSPSVKYFLFAAAERTTQMVNERPTCDRRPD